MKKIITLSLALIACNALTKAQTFSEDFEAYTVGSALGPQSPNWTVWSGTAGEGGTTDPLVASTDNHTTGGSKSIHFSSTASTGGPNDCVLPFGGTPLTTGQFTFSAWFKIPTGKDAYFNFQGGSPPYTGTTMYTLDLWMNSDGSLVIQNSGTPVLTTTHPFGSWFQLTIDANLNTNDWNLLINGTSMGTWTNAIDQVGGIDIYPADATASFWLDDVSYNIVPYTLPALNGAVTNLVVSNGLVSQVRTPNVTIRNLGVDTITSFDLGIVANGTPSNQTVSGVSIPSLATYTVTASSPVTLINGVNTFSTTISNVNGLGADGDLTDDSKTLTLTPHVAAPGKMVVGEEATGTWCQWCPRGAVYMDMMHNKYDGYFAGIAVHNGDVMTNTMYDAGMGGLIQGYPTALVDRLPGLDPSAMETDFLTRIQVAPKEFIVNGATYNASTHVLNVSVTSTIQQNITGNYTIACVITEDSVHGTASGYNQANAYSGGGSGVMGGFELLGNPVPAAQMHYNHVARIIKPSFTGQYQAFGASANTGQVFTWNFIDTLNASWNSNKINIIGMVMDPTGKIDNAATTTIAQAVTNGYVSGTLATGITEVNQADATVSLSPNPANENSNIFLNLVTESTVQVAIYNVAGELVANKDYGRLSGGMMLPIESSKFAAGIYFVNVTIDGKSSMHKLVKQ